MASVTFVICSCTQYLFRTTCFQTSCSHISLRFKKVAMSIQDLDETRNSEGEREWNRRHVKVIRDYAGIFEPIDQMMDFFGPVLYGDLSMQTLLIGAALAALEKVVIVNIHIQISLTHFPFVSLSSITKIVSTQYYTC